MKRFTPDMPSQTRRSEPAELGRSQRARLSMKRRIGAIAAVMVVPFLGSDMAVAQVPAHPFDFFEGVTETVGILKVVMRSPVHTRSIGRGEIEADGSFRLVQRVEDEGREPYVRRWTVRKIAPTHFTGTMSEASGPVTIDEIGNRFRFRFRMSGGLSVEEWLTPLPGSRSARNQLTVRKFGIRVASADGVVRKIS